MRVLQVASECAPFAKTGGLADILGALPKALAGEGVECDVLMPLYPALGARAKGAKIVAARDDLHGGPARVLRVKAEGLSLLLLDAPHLYDRPGSLYVGPDGRDWHDNAIRFAALSQIGAELAEGYDVLHAHDWQAGLAPLYLAQGHAPRRPTVMTIHNIAFQGVFGAAMIGALGLDPAGFTPEGYEYHGQISLLKAGLVCADRITTVSPAYARELTTPQFGMGLQGVIAARRDAVIGLLNGIDEAIWDPRDDPHLTQNYSARSLPRRARNRAALEARFGLEPGDGPLFCMVTRLTWQKGADLALEALPRLLERGGRLVMLGSGEPALESAFRAAAAAHPGRVGVEIGYDEPLAHQIQGGADVILIPSRFEPCGLTQLYGLRYGCLPLVARTGGLADTVIDANEAALSRGCADGFQFAPPSANALAAAIDRACDAFADTPLWTGMIRNAMARQVGWDASARAYAALYRDLAG